MKRFVLSFIAFPLLLSLSAAGQNDGQSKGGIAKPFVVSGKVSEDGKRLIPVKGDAWSISNPGALVGHEGQQVKVKCQLASASHDIRVLSIKRVVSTQIKFAANPSDSAFRR